MLHTLRQVEYYDAVPIAGGIVWDRTARHIADLIKANANDQGMPQGARKKWVWLQHYWDIMPSLDLASCRPRPDSGP